MSSEALMHCAWWVPLPFTADFTVSNKAKNEEISTAISEQIDVEQGFNMRKQVCPTSDSWDTVRKLNQSYFPWQLAVGTVNTQVIPQFFVFAEGGVCCLNVLFV